MASKTGTKVLDGPYLTVMGSTGSIYKIWALGMPEQWCSCPAYKFQRLPVSQRQCKHTRAALAAAADRAAQAA